MQFNKKWMLSKCLSLSKILSPSSNKQVIKLGPVLLLAMMLGQLTIIITLTDDFLPNNAEEWLEIEEQLEQPQPQNVVTLPHGNFFFWQHSHQVKNHNNNSSIEQSLTDEQKSLLDDEDIDINTEKARCTAYNFGFPNQTITKRRRLFLGSLIADDSMEVLKAVGMEAYNIFDTVSYVESNVTQNLSPRKWRYLTSDLPSQETHKLYQLFGPQTKVSVDYYVTSRSDNADKMLHEKLQKEGIVRRWKMNGMRQDDVAIIADADETFTRDFLRALQICDVPQLRSKQSCSHPKLISSTLVIESSPECITKKRRWHHPDAILGECVDLIGDSTLHPPPMRTWIPNNNEPNITKRIHSSHGARMHGYGRAKNYSLYELVYNATSAVWPLWSAGDFRDAAGGEMIYKKGGGWTGYHFHNFFDNLNEIHWKYYTYGHAHKNAMLNPIWKLNKDLELAVACARGNATMANFENGLGDNDRPIYYLVKAVRKKRHLAWQHIVQDEISQQKQRKVYVDLGANCGNTYLEHKRDFMHDHEEEWEVYLWEPSPQMHEFFLNDLAKENPNITVIPYAAGVRNETLQLYVHKGQEHVKDKVAFRDGGACDLNSPYNPSGGSSIFKDAKVAGDPVSIMAINFSEWLASLQLEPGDRFIFKIDIEGAEVEIIEHMLLNPGNIDTHSICLAELIEMEFHKNMFEKGTELYIKHEAFESTFHQRFKSKCGRDINFKRLS